MIQCYDNCFECKACVQICPQNCIKFNNGVLNIDEKSCIRCGLCDSVCQIQHPVFYEKLGKVYAAVGISEDTLNMSSSGGMANILYHHILEKKGIIFGAKYATDLEPNMSYTDDKKNLNDFLRSKYCFSNIGDSYKKCKEFCDNNKTVLYIGLPCQIAGLKLYLKKEYKNLFLVDILCHGAPHYSIFKNHIAYLESKQKKKIIDYQFRNKEFDRYGPYHYTITYANKQKKSGSALWDAYYNAFLKSNIFREACYSCVYARKERISDITLGDFWNAKENIEQLYEKKYISSIIINTVKGEKLLNECKDKIHLYPSTYEMLEKSTHAICQPAKKTHNTDIERLKEYKYYFKWASRYENSLCVILRKIKNMIAR